MKILIHLVATVLLFPITLFAAGGRDAMWKEVEDAANKGLPKTAIEKLTPIVDAAMNEKAWPEAIKAIATRINYEGMVQGGKPEEKIFRMEAEMVKAPKEMLPVMEAILAHWYWQYFQQNRHRFMQRTQTAAAPGKDITTWDLARLFAEIDVHFTKALAADAELKKNAVGTFDALLEKGTVPDAYRPTLYDFLAHEALAFYASGEQAAAKAEDEFELDADGPVFGTIEEFVKWEPKGDSNKVKALLLYQSLLRFHAEDADKSALLHCDLERIRLGKNHATGEEKSARHKAALKRFAEQWADHEMSAWARAEWAQVLVGEDESAEAHKIAKQGAGAFPASIGGRLCFNLIQQIEAKSSQVSIERVWNVPHSPISVRYRNVTEIHFRVVEAEWTERLKRNGNFQWLEDNECRALLAAKPDKAWSAKLPPTPDFRERVEEVEVPKDLKPGFYYLIASNDPGFRDENNVVTFTDFWVSDLAIVVRSAQGAEKAEGFVLDANSGQPVEGADVQLWISRDNGSFSPGQTVKTDANGLFSTQAAHDRSVLALVSFKNQRLATNEGFQLWRQNRGRGVLAQTIFFTDRSLYRPGQTIRYKGICISADRDNDNYKVLGGQAVTVVFSDANGKEIAKAEHKANDYGSFNGSFTAPRDRLMGQMMIRTTGAPHGMASVSVEEYKRPKFQVAVDAPKVPGKLGEKVGLEGKATAYTGAAIGGAKVRYRVVREVRFPDWWGRCFWWRPMPSQAAQEIAHGTTVTKDDGTFAVEFPAKPDRSVSEKDEPTFSFTVHADVTDTTGETRTAQRGLNIGYTALKASLSADEWQTAKKAVDVAISTQTNDGEGQAAEGVVKVHRLKQPAQVVRPNLTERRSRPWRGAKPLVPKETEVDPGNPNSWELGEVAAESAFKTDGAGNVALPFKLQAGPYRAMLETKDRFGKKVTAQLQFNVLNLDNKPIAVHVPNIVAAPKWTLEPGAEFMALWGTGYAQARAFIEVEHRGKMLQSFWTENGLPQQQVKQAVTEAMRGGFTLHVTMVRENRAYLTSRRVDVPWSNKLLTVKWEHFTSKLEPAQKETWTAVITGPDAKKAVAELVCALYDQSLDASKPHQWQRVFGVFRQDFSRLSMQFQNVLKPLNHLHGQWAYEHKDASFIYRRFPDVIAGGNWGYDDGIPGLMMGRAGGGRAMPMAARSAAPMPKQAMEGNAVREEAAGFAADAPAGPPADYARKKNGGDAGAPAPAPAPAPPPAIDLGTVTARKNLNETAFFFPQLIAREDGSVAMEFTMPEALTTWRFMGFAHDRDLRSGYIEDKVVTAKDIMVQPNPPRFLREGDALEFTVKVSNQSATRQAGKVRLTLANARTGKSVDADFANAVTDQAFDLPSHESRSFSWKLMVPDGAEPLSYKAVGSTEKLSDGEEGLLPVLSRRTLVTESLPLPIRGAQTKKFEFKRLIESGKSDTLKSQSLTVQMVSNPSWYAVMALPYLMEFPHECSEQTFNRLYANALARHISASDPKIRAVFDQWKGTPALDSPLEKNQDIKSVLLDETPWLQQAKSESQARRNVGILFDDNRLNDETERTLRKLAEMQHGDGAWPWFPGDRGDDYITLYITTGFGRLRHLGVKIDTAPAIKSLARLDAWIDRIYRDIPVKDRDLNHLNPTIAFYLYGRSFFLAEKPIAPAHKEAVDYFLGQARKHWLALRDRQPQGHLAIALKRFGDKDAAVGIMKSLQERSVSNEEMGMSWRDTEHSWSWFRAPIESQALMIEAFDEVMNDAKAVEDCKVWLLKQKQTQDWKTTKATADAIYALLLRGDNLLASDALVEVSLAGNAIKPEKVEAGTGFYEERFARGEVKPEQGHITLKKTDKGVSWGSVHWQYLEDMAKVTAYDGMPLKLTKALFTKQLTKKGPVLEAVKGAVKVGDELVVRITLHTDRDMEYVHLKDHRGSGTDPVNVLSRFKFQDGLGYYESTRDTASHFFISYLPKGNYVFEYTTRVVHRGRYQTGFANIQCMYAPEFGGHSESLWLDAE
jgi:uncharacterized protein YfaS (alpha-2-macroglobulin family)